MRALAIGFMVFGGIVLFFATGYVMSEVIDDPPKRSSSEASRENTQDQQSGQADEAAVQPQSQAAGSQALSPPQGTPLPLSNNYAPSSTAEGSSGQTAGETQAGTGTTAGGGVGGPMTGGGGGGSVLPLPAVADRKVVQTATMALTVDDVFASVKKVEDIAVAAGGFVAESNLLEEELARPVGSAQDEPAPKRQTATIKIRVPAASYNDVLNQLRGIASERDSENSIASEVTEEYADLEARLRNLQATEGRYLELLDRAETIGDILTMEDRLNSVRLQIEELQGRLNLLNDLTEMATITVTMSPPPLPVTEPREPQPAPEPVVQTEPNWAEDSWNNAWEKSEDVLEAIGRAGITAAVVAVWIAVPGLALLAGWRLFRLRGARKGAT